MHGNAASLPANSRRKGGRLRLLTRNSLDGRTRARKQFDAIAAGIAVDLGGEDRLSTVQRHLIEAFAGAAVHVHDLNARLLLGQEVDINAHAHAISTLVRVATRVGIDRIAKNLTPTLQDIMREHREHYGQTIEHEPDGADDGGEE